MKDCRCVICKYSGDHGEKLLNKDRIFRSQGRDVVVQLCYTHSWELFRGGQRKFLERYRANLMNFFGTETEQELIDFVKGVGESPLSRYAA